MASFLGRGGFLSPGMTGQREVPEMVDPRANPTVGNVTQTSSYPPQQNAEGIATGLPGAVGGFFKGLNIPPGYFEALGAGIANSTGGNYGPAIAAGNLALGKGRKERSEAKAFMDDMRIQYPQMTQAEYDAGLKSKLVRARLYEQATGTGSKTYQTITGEEAAAMGLDPNKVYNRGSDGKISQVGGSQVTVNTGDKGKYAEGMGKYYSERAGKIFDSANASATQVQKLNRMEQALSNPDVYTGTGGEAVLNAKRLAESLGFEVSGTSDAEVVKSISSELALAVRNPDSGLGMPGAMSDKDREFLQSIPPGLGKTPEGNMQLLDYARRIQKRNMEVAQLARTWMSQNEGTLDYKFDQFLADWREKNPLFPESAPAPPPDEPIPDLTPEEEAELFY